MTATANLYRLYDGTELGVDGYPPIWHLTLKYDVRERAGYRCVRCEHPFPPGTAGEWSPCDGRCSHKGPVRLRAGAEGDWVEFDLTSVGVTAAEARTWPLGPYEVEAAWRILTVHHLDGVKANCRWWNLAPLCQRCHLTIQGKVRMNRPYLGEHSRWFLPYVAAYYAFDRLGEDLTREETEARLDELLALEHRQGTLAL